MSKKLNIAICTCFNDIEELMYKKKNLQSVKTFLTYKQQFEILYNSIKKNLKSVDYKIYIFNTIPFSKELNEYYCKNGIIVLTRPSDHKYYNRPEIYLENIICDYKLILDVDTIIVNNFDNDIINYIKKYECMASYGYRNINSKSYSNILNKLNLKLPKEINNLNNNNNFNFSNIGSYYLHLNQKKTDNIEKIFPYFNNGCIIIKNDKSEQLGKLWKIKRMECYKKNILDNFGTCGELTIGLCINHLFNNWKHCPKGFNLCCNYKITPKYINLDFEKFTKPYIIHYINVPYNSKLYNKYLKQYMDKYIIN